MSKNKSNLTLSQKEIYIFLLRKAYEQVKQDPNKCIFEINLETYKTELKFEFKNEEGIKEDLEKIMIKIITIVADDSNIDKVTMLSYFSIYNNLLKWEFSELIRSIILKNGYMGLI